MERVAEVGSVWARKYGGDYTVTVTKQTDERVHYTRKKSDGNGGWRERTGNSSIASFFSNHSLLYSALAAERLGKEPPLIIKVGAEWRIGDEVAFVFTVNSWDSVPQDLRGMEAERWGGPASIRMLDGTFREVTITKVVPENGAIHITADGSFNTLDIDRDWLTKKAMVPLGEDEAPTLPLGAPLHDGAMPVNAVLVEQTRTNTLLTQILDELRSRRV